MKLKFVISYCLIYLTFFVTEAQYLDELHLLIDNYQFTEENSNALDSLIKYHPDTLSQKELADSYHDLAYRWYYKKGWKVSSNLKHLNQSIEYFKFAVETKKSFLNSDPNYLKRSLYNLGVMYTLKTSYFEAINQFRQIIEIPELNTLTVAALGELGKLYSFVGDFHNAIHSLDQLISTPKSSSLTRQELTKGYYRRAETYTKIDAKKYNDQIQSDLQKADSLVSVGNNHWSPIFKNRILQLEGNRLLINNEYRESIGFFEQVLHGLPPTDTINLAFVHNSIGLAYLESKNYKKANFNLNKAISYDKNNSLAYENLGEIYLDLDSFDLAIDTYQNAINCTIGIKPDHFDYQLNAEDLQFSNKKYFLLGHILAKANALTAYYHNNQDATLLHQALETFDLADQLVDIIRFESSEYKSKLYWREQSASLYLKAVEVCHLLNKPDQAYYFMEKNKAILLLEDIGHEQAKENSDIPTIIAAREYKLKQEIAAYENQLVSIKDQSPDSIQVVRNKLYLHKQVYAQFIDSLELIYPSYAKTKRKVDLVNYNDFKQEYISEEGATLHYILNQNKGFGLLHTAHVSHLFEIDSVPQLQEQIGLLNQKLSQIITTQSELNAYNQLSSQVYQQLLPPLVHDHVKDKKLTIIPDYTLQQLSFETLNYDLETPNSYLINLAEIKYAYSISHLTSNSRIIRNATYNFIGFAPVDFNNFSLSRLDMSEQEVTFLQELYEGQSMLYEQASKQCFLDTLNLYKIIHLSTHADINDKGQDPWIAFHDQKISLTEIYNTKNQADMVVLSACNTSLGELKKGEGVMSFARGFFYGGTKSVISSLWSTNDKSNQEIIIDFYKGMKDGLQKSEALRAAKLKYIETHSGIELSPFYWGSLILIGDNANITLSNDNRVRNYWISGVIILLTLFILLIVIKNKRNQLAST